MSTGPTNSSAPTTSQVVGAVYNATTPFPADKQAIALQVDNEGNLLVNVAVGGGGGGGTVKIEDTSGNALNSNGSGALQVAVVSGGGSNPSVGTIGSTAPTSATFIGVVNGSGNIEGVGSANPVRIDPTGTTIQPVSGTITADIAGHAGAILDGTAGAPSTGVLTVQGVGGGTAVPISGSVSITGNPADNIAQWGGTAVFAATNTSTDGTEFDPIVRATTRKFGQIVTTTPLAANAVFTGPWIDTNQTGDTYVSFSWVSNVSSANGVSIQQTDDSTNAGIGVGQVGLSGNASASGTLFGIVQRRYWRVRYPNGGTAQTTFELVATGSDIPPNLQLFTAVGVPYLNTVTASTDAMACLGLPWQTGGGNAQGSNAVLPVGQFVMTGDLVAVPNGQQFAALRTPSVFKTAQFSASGLTPVWTPVSAKKFRLMKFQVLVSANASTVTTPQVVTASLFDAGTITSSTFSTFSITSNVLTLNGTFSGFLAGQNVLLTGFTNTYLNNITLTLTTASASVLTATFNNANVGSTADTTGTATAGYISSFDFYLPATAIAAPIGDAFQSGWIDLGNGYLSVTANNPLAMMLNFPISTGVGRIVMCGTEE